MIPGAWLLAWMLGCSSLAVVSQDEPACATLAVARGDETAFSTTASLSVRIDGLKSSKGRVGWALYDSAEAYQARAGAVRSGWSEVRRKSCELEIGELEVGDYALMVFHDRNRNRQLDRGAFGIPKEPYGFSNDPRTRFGPPPFAKTRFRVDAGPNSIELRLR